MDTKSPRLAAFEIWQQLNGRKTKRVAIEAGLPPTTLAAFAQGKTRSMSPENEQKIADHYGVRVEDIFINPKRINDVRNEGVPIIGEAAAGPDGHFLDAYPMGGYPTLEPFPDGSVAVTVVGDSMEPRFYPKERLVFGPIEGNPLNYLGKEVLVRLEDEDGRTLIKILDRNKSTGNWNLLSYNPRHPMIEDIKLNWIRPFVGLRV